MVQKKRETRVELFVFSGRPNPAWSLNEEQARELFVRFRALEPGAGRRALYDGLGYRGFRVTGFQDYDEILIQHEIVEATRGGQRRQWRDESRTLETYLLGTSQPHLEADLFRFIGSAI